jgi:hypothetical protein
MSSRHRDMESIGKMVIVFVIGCMVLAIVVSAYRYAVEHEMHGKR